MSLAGNDATPGRPRLVCLVGFMGAGKTTVGKELAGLLKWKFLDLDDVVEARERAAVAEIFSRAGQAAFRNAETEALHDVLEQSKQAPLVLALGGGAFSQMENAAMLKDAGARTVFLQAQPQELWQRCQAGGQLRSRPLLQDVESFTRLYQQRLPQYQRAEADVVTGGKSPQQVATEIKTSLGLR
jgi:shikimate kinase